MIEYENLKKANEEFFPEFEAQFKSVLDSGWFVLGKNVEAFEKEFSAYLGIENFVGLGNGLDALSFALRALDLPPMSEVIVPSNTYIATILSILQTGHRPVLVEPDLGTYNIDPQRIQEKITGNTRAIMVVHLYGKACEMDPIIELCQKNKLFLIEDAAQSHGAKYKNKMTGSFGDFSAFSFYPTKNLGGLGDGGGLGIRNRENIQTIKRLRNYGSDIKYHNEIVGYNSRLDEVQAALLRVKLKKIDKINNQKRKLAKIYLENLKDDFIKPAVNSDFHDVYHIFNIRHSRRDQVKEYLQKNEIKTEIHYPIPPHKQKALSDIQGLGDYPIAQLIHETTLSLPISYFHTVDDVSRVVEVLNRF